LKSVASSQPLVLGPGAANLKVVPLGGPGRRTIGVVRWSADSSQFFGIAAPVGKAKRQIVQIVNVQGQEVASGALPAGSLFRSGWFAGSQALYLYLGRSSDEFGSGVVMRCQIEGWKCQRIVSDVLDASAGGDGVLGLVRAVGKYSNDGEVIKFPPAYLVEIRNEGSQVVARQTFKSGDRDGFKLAVAPNGMKAVLTWIGRSGPGCSPEDQASRLCRDGIVVDLSGRLK
jgi:hypothetical protein